MQKDLFGGAMAAAVLPSQSESKSDFLQKYNFTFRLDQVIIGVLVLMVAYVLVFSFGVESGKRFAMAEIKSERAMRERMARELGEKIFSNPSTVPAVVSAQAVSSPIDTSKSKPMDSVKATVAAPSVDLKGGAIAAQAESPTVGKFVIQTVTFTTKTAAEKHVELLAAKGFKASVFTRGKFQQVRVNGFETKEKALETLRQLKSQGLAPKDAFIRNAA